MRGPRNLEMVGKKSGTTEQECIPLMKIIATCSNKPLSVYERRREEWTYGHNDHELVPGPDLASGQ